MLFDEKQKDSLIKIKIKGWSWSISTLIPDPRTPGTIVTSQVNLNQIPFSRLCQCQKKNVLWHKTQKNFPAAHIRACYHIYQIFFQPLYLPMRGVLNKVLYVEAPPRGPNPYLLYTIFDRKGDLFHIPTVETLHLFSKVFTWITP